MDAVHLAAITRVLVSSLNVVMGASISPTSYEHAVVKRQEAQLTGHALQGIS